MTARRTRPPFSFLVYAITVALLYILTFAAAILPASISALGVISESRTTACCAVTEMLILFPCRCSGKVSFNHSASARQSFSPAVFMPSSADSLRIFGNAFLD